MLWLIIPPAIWIYLMFWGPLVPFDRYSGVGLLLVDILLLVLTTSMVTGFGWMMGILIGSLIPKRWLTQTYDLVPLDASGKIYVSSTSNINSDADSPLFSLNYSLAVTTDKGVESISIFDYYRDRVALESGPGFSPTYQVWHGAPASWWGKWVGLRINDWKCQIRIPTGGITYQ